MCSYPLLLNERILNDISISTLELIRIKIRKYLE